MNLLKKCRYGLTIYNNSDMYVGKSIENYGEFSEFEVQVFRELLKTGDCVIDAGANIGCHTLAFQRLVGDNGTVFAFEPERNNFAALCGNIAINNFKNVWAYQKALGKELGHIIVPELDLDRTTNFGSLSLCEDYSNSLHYKVPLETIDSMNFQKLNLIKVDVEGMESLVLQGAVNTIKKLKPYLYVEDDRVEKSNDLIALIKSFGYILYKHQTRLFNPNNYFFKTDNLFIENRNGQFLEIISANLFCHHESMPCIVDTNKHNMIKL